MIHEIRGPVYLGQGPPQEALAEMEKELPRRFRDLGEALAEYTPGRRQVSDTAWHACSRDIQMMALIGPGECTPIEAKWTQPASDSTARTCSVIPARRGSRPTRSGTASQKIRDAANCSDAQSARVFDPPHLPRRKANPPVAALAADPCTKVGGTRHMMA
jgi:hypothetical protein